MLEWTWTCLGRGLELVRGGLELDLDFGWRRTWDCIPLQLHFLDGWRIRMCCSENDVLIDSFSRIWWSGLEAERWDHRGGMGEEEQYQDSPLHSCSSELGTPHPVSSSGWQHCYLLRWHPPTSTQCERTSRSSSPAHRRYSPESVTRRTFSNTAKPRTDSRSSSSSRTSALPSVQFPGRHGSSRFQELTIRLTAGSSARHMQALVGIDDYSRNGFINET